MTFTSPIFSGLAQDDSSDPNMTERRNAWMANLVF
jgi:hypothetical protein